jgi:DNA-binding NtrC family response regulator
LRDVTRVPAPARARLLIVDDEESIRGVLAEYFGRQYEVEQASTAVAALTAFRRRRPDVVLLDLMMPGTIAGQDIVGVMGAEVPVIVITAVTDLELARRALSEGAFDFVMKPFDLKRVGEIIEAALVHGSR